MLDKTLLDHPDDANEAFIIACAINLYKESLRKISNRILFVADDIEPLFAIITELLKDKSFIASGTLPAGRAEALTAEEAENLLTVGGQVSERRV
mgnify:CR=1 FL=1